jgi:uncharacterized protein (DUF488 family)
MGRQATIWTVGHSNHDVESFIALLEQHEIGYLVDVRSYPYSRFPHFDREQLASTLERQAIRYIFLGTELGGRPARTEHLDPQGHALYGKMAREPEFAAALERLVRGAAEHRIALMCSCGKPQDCHRRLLVGKVACERGAELRHILADGRTELETSVQLETDLVTPSLFGDDERRWRSTRSVSRRRRLRTSSTA